MLALPWTTHLRLPHFLRGGWRSEEAVIKNALCSWALWPDKADTVGYIQQAGWGSTKATKPAMSSHACLRSRTRHGHRKLRGSGDFLWKQWDVPWRGPTIGVRERDAARTTRSWPPAATPMTELNATSISAFGTAGFWKAVLPLPFDVDGVVEKTVGRFSDPGSRGAGSWSDRGPPVG
jgi:hypothetical protein